MYLDYLESDIFDHTGKSNCLIQFLNKGKLSIVFTKKKPGKAPYFCYQN